MGRPLLRRPATHTFILLGALRRRSPGSASATVAVATATPIRKPSIESWFGKLKERELWLNEYETLDDARRGIGGYVNRYHHRPHSGLDYRTPDEVRRTWKMDNRLQTAA